jgi:MATE family multidrug resistance protein
MAPSGIAISTSTLVGHAIGGGKHENARLCSHAAAYLIIAFAGLELLVLGSLHQYLSLIFTSDPAVTDAFQNISMCVPLFVIFDCFQTVESGVLRGLGLQSFGAQTNLFVYYIFGLPLGFFLAFYYELGVPGLVIGLVSCVETQTCVFFWRLSGIDWEEEMENAARRIEEERPKAIIREAANSFGGYRTPSDASSDEEEELSVRADERQQHGFMH